MTTIKSRKAKAGKLQNWIRDKLIQYGIPAKSLRCAIMGETGADVKILTPATYNRFPFKIEAKCRQNIKTLYELFAHAERHKAKGSPMLVLKRDRDKPLVVLDAEEFIKLWLIKN